LQASENSEQEKELEGALSIAHTLVSSLKDQVAAAKKHSENKEVLAEKEKEPPKVAAGTKTKPAEGKKPAGA